MVKLEKLIGTKTILHVVSSEHLELLIPHLPLYKNYRSWYKEYSHKEFCINLEDIYYAYKKWYKSNTPYSSYNFISSDELLNPSIKEIWF